MSENTDKRTMGKEDRQRVVLEFLRDHPLALPPKLIYRNLKLRRNITFSDQSVDNYLAEFDEEGLVMRVKMDPLDSGELVEAGDDERAYYVITDAGVEYLED